MLMPSNEFVDPVAQRRLVDAMAVLENKVDLRGYPHRYLGVVCDRGRSTERVTYVIAAVEILDRFGWDLVNVTEFFDHSAYAFLRRRG